MPDCRTCCHADLSSDNAIKECVHPFFKQPVPATIYPWDLPLENTFRIVEDHLGVESVNRSGFAQNTIIDCPLYEEADHA